MNIFMLLVLAVTVGAVVFGVMTLAGGGDPGLRPAEPDGRARPLPSDRPLREGDVGAVTFDVTWRGYRMAQVDQTLRRLAYDIGYKSELISVLEAEIAALREGRTEDADALADARAAALRGPSGPEKPEGEPEVIDLAEAEPVGETESATEEPAVEPEPETDSDREREAHVSKSVT